jgi:hypothetical protein
MMNVALTAAERRARCSMSVVVKGPKSAAMMLDHQT